MSKRARFLNIATALIVLASAGPAAADSKIQPVAFDRGSDPTLATVPTVPLMFYVPDPGETPHVVLSQTATDLVITAASAKNLTPTAPCVADSATVAHCPLAELPAGWFGAVSTDRPLTLDTTPGVTVNLLANAFPDGSVLHGGAGADVLTAGTGGVVDGGAGDDHLSGIGSTRVATLRGGDGDDQLLDAADAQGGAGDDTIGNAIKADGGAGADQLTGVQDGDGGDGDDVLTGASLGGPIRLDGGTGADDLTGGGAGAILHGGTGNDRLAECPDCASAGALLAGDDGSDTILGRANGATLDGGDGADTIDTLSGRTATTARVGDPVKGGAGNDTIDATDLVTQAVDCGDGTDTVQRDRDDKLTACEKDLGASAGGGVGAPDGAGGSSPSKGPSGSSAKAVKIKGSVARLRASSKGVVRLTLTCPAKLSCGVKVGLKQGKTTLASTTVTFKGTKAISLKLKPKTLAELRRRGSLKKLALQFTAASRSGTRAMPKTQKITLLAPKKAKAQHR